MKRYLPLTCLILWIASTAVLGSDGLPSQSISENPQGDAPGVVIPAAQGGGDCGTLVIASDSSYENAFAWSYGGQAAPNYGAFAERFTGETEVCAIVLDLTLNQNPPDLADLYVWADLAGEPGAVISLTTNVDPGPIDSWPNVSRHVLSIAPACTPSAWWVGFWGHWPGGLNSWFVGADLGGPAGSPRTNIAPGLGYPTGWSNVSVVWGPTQALGIGAQTNDCASTGACCFDDGSCLVLSGGACLDGSGEYQGDDVPCSPDPCIPSGACCFSSVCFLVTSADCASSGGSYLGDDVACTPLPCVAETVGACCFGDLCASLTECACEDNGGVYMGDATDCESESCSTVAIDEDEDVDVLGSRIAIVGSNPTAGAIRYSLDLEASGAATVRLFDVDGQQVDVLLDSELSAGAHAFHWTPAQAGLASGVYYLVLETDGERSSKKVVLVK